MTDTDTTADTPSLPLAKRHRRALPWWAQVVVLLVVFIAGGVAGSMTTARVIHSRMEEYRQQAPIFSKDIVMRLRMRLTLSDEQATKVQEIIERQHSKMIQCRNEGSQKMHVEFDAMVEEVADALDEFQTQQWYSISNYVRQTYLPAAVKE